MSEEAEIAAAIELVAELSTTAETPGVPLDVTFDAMVLAARVYRRERDYAERKRLGLAGKE